MDNLEKLKVQGIKLSEWAMNIIVLAIFTTLFAPYWVRTTRCIQKYLIPSLFSRVQWHQVQEPNSGLWILDQRISYAIEGMKYLEITEYAIDSTFLIHPELPSDYFLQRITEAAWPIKQSADANIWIATVDKPINDNCKLRWEKGEVKIVHCTPP